MPVAHTETPEALASTEQIDLTNILEDDEAVFIKDEDELDAEVLDASATAYQVFLPNMDEVTILQESCEDEDLVTDAVDFGLVTASDPLYAEYEETAVNTTQTVSEILELISADTD